MNQSEQERQALEEDAISNTDPCFQSSITKKPGDDISLKKAVFLISEHVSDLTEKKIRDAITYAEKVQHLNRLDRSKPHYDWIQFMEWAVQKWPVLYRLRGLSGHVTAPEEEGSRRFKQPDPEPPAPQPRPRKLARTLMETVELENENQRKEIARLRKKVQNLSNKVQALEFKLKCSQAGKKGGRGNSL